MAHTPTPWYLDETCIEHHCCHVNAVMFDEDADHRVLIAEITTQGDAAFIVNAVNAHDDLIAALKQSMTAIDDWLNIFADDLCNEERVAEARARVGAGGTLWYIATVQEINRNALKLAGA